MDASRLTFPRRLGFVTRYRCTCCGGKMRHLRTLDEQPDDEGLTRLVTLASALYCSMCDGILEAYDPEVDNEPAEYGDQ